MKQMHIVVLGLLSILVGCSAPTPKVLVPSTPHIPELTPEQRLTEFMASYPGMDYALSINGSFGALMYCPSADHGRYIDCQFSKEDAVHAIMEDILHHREYKLPEMKTILRGNGGAISRDGL